MDEVLKLRRPVLRRTPSLMVHTDLLDCQLYVLDVKAVSKGIWSIHTQRVFARLEALTEVNT